MSLSHICLACRRKLPKLFYDQPFQWQARATFVSLSNVSRKTKRDTSIENNDVSNLVGEDSTQESRYAAVRPQRRRAPAHPRNGDAGDQLESLFEETLKSRPPSTPSPGPPVSVSSLESYKHAETLKEMLAGSYPLSDSWYYFVEHFGPDSASFKARDKKPQPSYLNRTANELLRRLIHTMEHDSIPPSFPKVTDISRVCYQLGLLRGSEWVNMVNFLLQEICKVREQPAKDSAYEKELILDLVGAWNVVCRTIGSGQPPDYSNSFDWSNLPFIAREDAVQVNSQRGTDFMFGLLVPAFSVRHLRPMPIIALATFEVLAGDKFIDHQSIDCAPLISTLGNVIGVSGIDIASSYDICQELGTGYVATFVKTNWAAIKNRASLMPAIGSTGQTGKAFKMNRAKPKTEIPDMKLSFISKRLHDAFKTRNLHEIDSLWADVTQWPVHDSKRRPETESEISSNRGTLSDKLCNNFILTYMGIRQPSRAIDVWNFMIQAGLTPTLQTWDAMLSGCKAAKDTKALEEVWNKMQLLGIQPDVHIWTTRISGLMACKSHNQAIQALDEMGRLWLQAAKHANPNMALPQLQKLDSVDGAVKPAIETINAIVVGLLRLHREKDVQKVLSWAATYDIKPDIITFNTLLRPLIRDNRSEEAKQLLKQMQTLGVQADVATFTTILEETLRHTDMYTPEELKEIVNSIFSEMQEAGVQPNMHTYAKIIYQLLSNSEGGISMVNAVLERILAQNLEPSPQIYTMIVEHFFNQNPPDLDAVRNLTERVSSVVGSADNIFWDRLIEGYARVRETGLALRILGKVQKTKSRVGWLSLRTLLLALHANQEYELAKTLVDNAIMDSGGPLHEDEKGAEGQHKFWASAKDLGLLRK